MSASTDAQRLYDALHGPAEPAELAPNETRADVERRIDAAAAALAGHLRRTGSPLSAEELAAWAGDTPEALRPALARAVSSGQAVVTPAGYAAAESPIGRR